MLDVIQTVLAVLTFVIVALEFSSKMPYISKVEAFPRPWICGLKVTVLHYMPRVIERLYQPDMFIVVPGCELCKMARGESLPQNEEGLSFQDAVKLLGLRSDGDEFLMAVRPKFGSRPEEIEVRLLLSIFGRRVTISRQRVSLQ